MKTRSILFALLLFCLTGLNAQTGWFGGSAVPLKPQSPLFGKDIMINDQLTQNQQAVTICSALNGWLFAAYSYNNTYNQTSVSIYKSIDNGINWTILFDGSVGTYHITIPKIELLACGNTDEEIKIFLGVLFYDTIYHSGGAALDRINATTGLLEAEILQDNDGETNDIGLACDNLFPALNSNPYSIAVILSKIGVEDSLIVETSSNGGISFDSKYLVDAEPYSSSYFFNKVALAYGISSSQNSGRYYAAWEKKLKNGTTNFGHIYTAHSEPNFNSPFTKPVCLDSLDPASINKVRNPEIACQYSNADNDSANLTEVVLFEKHKPSGGNNDVTGYYNLQAATTSHFRPLNIAATSNNELQPDISFNPYNSKFMVTYFDSTAKKLPFLTNDVNLTNPDSWNVVSSGYNDNSNLIAPYPKVRLNYEKQEGMNAWISEGTGGNGIALYDAQYLFPVGISESRTGTAGKLIGSYPNPCTNKIKIVFELKNSGKVNIEVMNIMGQTLGTITDQNYPAGKQTVQYDVSDLSEGNYLYKFRSGEFSAVGKFAVVR
jgi:hypothetical protein